LHRRSLSRRSFSRQLRRNHWFRGGYFCYGCFYRGGFDCGCGRSRCRPRSRSATTSAAATTAGRSWSRFTYRGRRSWFRGKLSRRLRLRLRSRWAARLHYGSFGRRSGLIVIVFRLQGLGCVACFLGGTVPGLLAALQALAHPFAHIACF
jgi:hypothetical protein